MTPDVESARADWETSYRRLAETAREEDRSETLRRQIGVVTEELRKRVGSTFTVGELAVEYWRAEAWTREAVGQRAPSSSWPADLALVEGAAFHLYARGAVDYAP